MKVCFVHSIAHLCHKRSCVSTLLYYERNNKKYFEHVNFSHECQQFGKIVRVYVKTIYCFIARFRMKLVSESETGPRVFVTRIFAWRRRNGFYRPWNEALTPAKIFTNSLAAVFAINSLISLARVSTYSRRKLTSVCIVSVYNFLISFHANFFLWNFTLIIYLS